MLAMGLFTHPQQLAMPAALPVNKLNASTKQIQTSNSIVLLHSVVFSSGVSFGVVGFLDVGIGFV